MLRTLPAALALAAVALQPAAGADPPQDPCAYMNHDSKAYFDCVARQRELTAQAARTRELVEAKETLPLPTRKPARKR